MDQYRQVPGARCQRSRAALAGAGPVDELLAVAEDLVPLVDRLAQTKYAGPDGRYRLHSEPERLLNRLRAAIKRAREAE
jgi:hypothetical protein